MATKLGEITRKLGDITRKRGDTFPFTITIKANGLPVNLDNYVSIDLCVSTEMAPIDDTTEVFTLVGVFDTIPTSGRVTFTMSEEQADNVGKFFYDVQAVDTAMAKRTFELPSNKFILGQDINKA